VITGNSGWVAVGSFSKHKTTRFVEIFCTVGVIQVKPFYLRWKFPTLVI
jgi:hypothetical protein